MRKPRLAKYRIPRQIKIEQDNTLLAHLMYLIMVEDRTMGRPGPSILTVDTLKEIMERGLVNIQFDTGFLPPRAEVLIIPPQE